MRALFRLGVSPSLHIIFVTWICMFLRSLCSVRSSTFPYDFRPPLPPSRYCTLASSLPDPAHTPSSPRLMPTHATNISSNSFVFPSLLYTTLAFMRVPYESESSTYLSLSNDLNVERRRLVVFSRSSLLSVDYIYACIPSLSFILSILYLLRAF